jgi:hypothetical protein
MTVGRVQADRETAPNAIFCALRSGVQSLSTAQRVSRGFHRLAFFILAATPLLFSASAEASSVTLNCSGKWWRTQPVTGEPVQGMALIVDFDQKEIRGSYASFNITSVTHSIVFFERPYSENGKPGKMYGWINRISGEAEFHGSRKGRQVISSSTN